MSSPPVPDVSIIMPFLNRQDQVMTCIHALLNQKVPPKLSYEIIAVDNGSTDGTAERIAGPRVRVVNCEVSGPAAARNAGLRAARAQIVAMCDSDCIPCETWLWNIIQPFSDPTILASGGRIEALHVRCGVAFFSEDFKVLNQEKFFTGGVLGFPPFLATANVAYRRDALFQIGCFDESLRIGEDSDVSWRLLEIGGRLAYCPDALVRHRHRETFGGLFRQAVDYGMGAAAVFAKHRDRLHRAVAVQWEDISFLAVAPFKALWAAVAGRNGYYRKRYVYEAIWRTGFIIGAARGSLRKRVIFL